MPGQIHVEMYRPERRFGWAAIVWMDDPFDGKRKVMRHGSEGEVEWVEVQRDVTVEPTYWFDDEVLKQLTAMTPQPAPDPAVPDVLRDSLERERLHADRLHDLTKSLICHVAN